MHGRARIKTDRYALDQCALFRLRGIDGLCDRLLTSRSTIERLARNYGQLYDEWDIQLRPGKTRHIEHPAPPLKKTQARIAQLLMRIEPPRYLYCPVYKRDFIENALAHLDQPAVWRIDIKSYFESTQSASVLAFFKDDMECAVDIANVLTKLSTFGGHLPTGSPVSPILSFYANRGMWRAIETLCERYGCRISVYMDDLSVSGPRVPYALRQEIRQIINAHGFFGHKEELAINRPALVTGMIVGRAQPRLPHSHFKKYRLGVDAVEKMPAGPDRNRAIAVVEGLRRLRDLSFRRISQRRRRTF